MLHTQSLLNSDSVNIPKVSPLFYNFKCVQPKSHKLSVQCGKCFCHVVCMLLIASSHEAVSFSVTLSHVPFTSSVISIVITCFLYIHPSLLANSLFMAQFCKTSHGSIIGRQWSNVTTCFVFCVWRGSGCVLIDQSLKEVLWLLTAHDAHLFMEWFVDSRTNFFATAPS